MPTKRDTARLKRLKERVERMEDCLRWIRDYRPKDKEVCCDEFAYDRLVLAYRDAARKGLSKR